MSQIVAAYGSADADIVLIRMAGEHDAAYSEKIFESIRENVDREFRMIVVKVDDWNRDLSPWEAPAVFGDGDFAGGAAKTLEYVKTLCGDKDKCYIIGGYSLAGLFALWAAYRTDLFAGVAAASPSVWFPGYAEYMRDNRIGSRAVYLSLGDREDKTGHPVLRTVGDRIREAHDLLRAQGVETVLEWNKGNHFKDADKRVVAAFSRVCEEVTRSENKGEQKMIDIQDIFSWLPACEMSLEEIETIVRTLAAGGTCEACYRLENDLPEDAGEFVTETVEELTSEGKKIYVLLRNNVTIAVIGYKEK